MTLKIGWILLLVVGIGLTLLGLGSLYTAYSRLPEEMAGVSMERLGEIAPDLPTVLRGRRATAASLSFASGVMLIWIASVPYRRGERWAWQAVVTSLGLALMLSLLRMPLLGTQVGAGTHGVVLALVLIALAVSYRDLR